MDEPPNSAFNSGFYHKYFEKDLESKEFIGAILKRIEKKWVNDPRFDKDQKLNSGEFKDYRAWVLNNKNEILNTNLYNLETPTGGFEITNKHEALFAFRLLEVARITRTQNSLGLNNNNTFFHRYQDFDS